jgi:hypothetical protein
MADVPAEERHQILAGNAVRIFNLDDEQSKGVSHER